MERSVSVRTPEAIEFYYELAGLGSRFLALFADLIIQGIIAFALIIVALTGAKQVSALASFFHVRGHALASTIIAVSVLLFFVIFYAYFIIFERYWNGQSPGKRMLGIRVVRDGGYPIELGASIIRNLVRIAEQLLGFYILSAISMILSSENKRLGDYAAGTIVVRDRGMEVRDPASWRRTAQLLEKGGSADLSEQLTAQELALVDTYMARRTTLDPKAARAAGARIAAALRPKLDPALAALSDDDLLMKVATRGSS